MNRPTRDQALRAAGRIYSTWIASLTEAEYRDFSTRVAARADCVIWTGAVQSSGYGSVADGRGGSKLAHRAAYEAAVGAIPEGMTIDHLCRTKLCVNPAHLEAVPLAENIRRAHAARTHCANGHPLTGVNVAINQRARGAQRECRTCRVETQRRYRARKAA